MVEELVALEEEQREESNPTPKEKKIKKFRF